MCQEPNHVPLRCNEVEKQDQEEERKKIEERLSEAMMRECWKCKVKYFKEEGCNKMTCPRPGCGAKMCYLCKAQVTDYTHFYGQGGAPDKKRSGKSTGADPPASLHDWRGWHNFHGKECLLRNQGI